MLILILILLSSFMQFGDADVDDDYPDWVKGEYEEKSSGI